MIERLSPPFGGGDGDADVFFNFFLADELREAAGTEIGVKRPVFGAGLTGYDASY
jgi:hypothetical protein